MRRFRKSSVNLIQARESWGGPGDMAEGEAEGPVLRGEELDLAGDMAEAGGGEEVVDLTQEVGAVENEDVMAATGRRWLLQHLSRVVGVGAQAAEGVLHEEAAFGEGESLLARLLLAASQCLRKCLEVAVSERVDVRQRRGHGLRMGSGGRSASTSRMTTRLVEGLREPTHWGLKTGRRRSAEQVAGDLLRGDRGRRAAHPGGRRWPW